MVSNDSTTDNTLRGDPQERVYFRVDATQSAIQGFLCNASHDSVKAGDEIVESMKLQLDVIQASLELNRLRV